MKKETKKSVILRMFNSKDWYFVSDRYATKTFTNQDFRDFDLGATIEYQDKYCDVIYARQILTKMGYKVGIGMAFHVYDYSQKKIA